MSKVSETILGGTRSVNRQRNGVKATSKSLTQKENGMCPINPLPPGTLRERAGATASGLTRRVRARMLNRSSREPSPERLSLRLRPYRARASQALCPLPEGEGLGGPTSIFLLKPALTPCQGEIEMERSSNGTAISELGVRLEPPQCIQLLTELLAARFYFDSTFQL